MVRAQIAAIFGQALLCLALAPTARLARATVANGVVLPAPPTAVRCARPVCPRSASPMAVADFGVALYELELSADALVTQNLATLSPVSVGVLYGAGLLTSLTPCCLSMLPLTFAYIGGLAEETKSPDGQSSAMLPALAFSTGLAIAFAVLGIVAASFGSIFGSSGDGAVLVLRGAVSLLAIGLGLDLLQLLPFSLPSLSAIDAQKLALPPAARAFFFGASSALVASPCASPVLASILGYVATLGEPLLGGGLLLCYTLGYTTPVLLTGVAAGSARKLTASLEGGLEWVSPASGAVLLAYGTYSALSTVFGAV